MKKLSFKVNKNLFKLSLAAISSPKPAYPICFKTTFYKNKFFIFLKIFINDFKYNNFFVFYFLEKLFLNYKLFFINTKRFKSILTIYSTIFNFHSFIFFNKFFVYELTTLDDNLWFNIPYLVNSNYYLSCAKNFIFAKLLDSINSFHIVKYLSNWFLNFNFQFHKIINFNFQVYEKLKFISNNNEIFLKNISLFNNFNSKIKTIFANKFLHYSYFNKFYFGYQIFLNNTLYINRLILFQSNISASSFNFLLLKNFNKFFFWTGLDYKNEFIIRELFLWGQHNVFFTKGYPFYSHNLEFKNNPLFLNLDYTNLSQRNELRLYNYESKVELELTYVNKSLFFYNYFFNNLFF